MWKGKKMPEQKSPNRGNGTRIRDIERREREREIREMWDWAQGEHVSMREKDEEQ